jgi:cytidylate kinase
MIVTVSRQIGAGGSEIASRVAAGLGFRLVDNELIDRVALQAGLSRTQVANREERAPGFLERLVRALSRSVPELQSAPADRPPEPEEQSLVAATERVVADLAAEGRVVLVGRAAPAVLSGSHDALHVKIVAPVPFRIARIREADRVDEREAERRLRESDANRARYHRHHYGRDWSDPANYHMVLNTGSLGLDGATDIIVGRARAMWRGSGE